MSGGMNVLILQRCMFFVCVSVITVWDSKTAGFASTVSCLMEMNQVGVFGNKNFKFPIVFKSARKNKITIKEKREFLRKIDFKNDFVVKN